MRKRFKLVGAIISRLFGWFCVTLYKARYILSGLIAYLLVLTLLVPHLSARRTRQNGIIDVDAFPDAAWDYITLAVAVIALAYPLSLSLRDSLTARLFNAYRLMQERHRKGGNALARKRKEFLDKQYKTVQNFRRHVFDIQLPAVGTFVVISVVRTLASLNGFGPFSVEVQIVEPQLYAGVLLVWVVWLMISVLVFKPFAAVEESETELEGLPDWSVGTFSKRLKDDPTIAHSTRIRSVAVLLLLFLVAGLYRLTKLWSTL